MAKRRNLGHISVHHAMKNQMVKFIDKNNVTGSQPIITSIFEGRLDYTEDQVDALNLKFQAVNSGLTNVINNVQDNSDNIVANSDSIVSLDVDVANISAEVLSNDQDIITINNELYAINSDMISLSSSLTSDIDSLSSSFSSTVATLSSDLYSSNVEISYLSSSLASLSSSFALLSASIGPGGNLNVNVPDDAELYFNGDTLMTDAAVYISGSGNNLYLHGTNEQGLAAKYEFSITSGKTVIKEVADSDFGEEVSDPWFKFDGDTLLTHADIYVSGSNNYLYLNGTDENGEYAIYYFDIVDGQVIIEQTGSIN